MIKPSLDALVLKVDSKYTLVVVAAKRARQMTDDANAAGDHYGKKPVTAALQEIVEGRIRYSRGEYR